MIKKRQRVGVPLICILDDDESVREAMVSLTMFITAYESGDIHIQALQAHGAGVLCKPFSQESLFQAVCSALASPSRFQQEG